MFVQLVCGDDGYAVQISFLIINLRIILFQKQRQAALVLFPLHNKHEADIQQIIGPIPQVIQYFAHVGPRAYNRVPLIIQHHLPYLAYAEIKQKVRAVSLEND